MHRIDIPAEIMARAMRARGRDHIFERIEAGDQEGAADAMRNHIMSMWQRKRGRASILDESTAG